MMRFDYSHDAPPDAIEYVRSLRLAEPLRAPIGAIITALLVVVAAWGIESYRAQQAYGVERAAETRLVHSRAALARTKLQRVHLEKLIALDQRLRGIRNSGSVLSAQLADIANHVPAHAWLTSISRDGAGISMSGRAISLLALSETIADLMSSKSAGAPTLVRAGRDDHDRSPSELSFEMRLQNGAK